MKKTKLFFIILLIVLFLTIHLPIYATANDELSLSANSAILIEVNTQKILYEKNATQKMYPASITKILTAIIVIENGNLNDTVKVDYDSISSVPSGYETANLQLDEVLTVEQLLQLLLIHSANDAANVLATHVGGSIDSFVSMMNTKLNELNLFNTHFTNAYGLQDENHYTTAQDMALLMKYCMKNETFRRIAGSASCSIPATNKYGTRRFSNTNLLLIPNNPYYYTYVTAGKTGYTSYAKNCLVSCAYKNDIELICVVLSSETGNDRFLDTIKLYQYGFENYELKTILNKGDIIRQVDILNGTKETRTLDLLSSDAICTLQLKNENIDNLTPEITINKNLQAPISQGEVLGTVTYVIDNVSYSSDLIASHSVEVSDVANIAIQLIFLIVIVCILYKLIKSK